MKACPKLAYLGRIAPDYDLKVPTERRRLPRILYCNPGPILTPNPVPTDPQALRELAIARLWIKVSLKDFYICPGRWLVQQCILSCIVLARVPASPPRVPDHPSVGDVISPSYRATPVAVASKPSDTHSPLSRSDTHYLCKIPLRSSAPLFKLCLARGPLHLCGQPPSVDPPSCFPPGGRPGNAGSAGSTRTPGAFADAGIRIALPLCERVSLTGQSFGMR